MSTICKLNPSIRVARTRRKNVIRQFLELSLRAVTLVDRADAADIAKRCSDVRRASGFMSWWKDRRFGVILARRGIPHRGAQPLLAGTGKRYGGLNASGAIIDDPAAMLPNRGPEQKPRGLWAKVKSLFGRGQ